jgi:flagellar hook-associated protein 1 FlgK
VEANPQNNANDLRDLRDQLLNKLSEFAPITVIEQPNGQVDVRIFGTGVVVGIRVAPFEVVSDPEDPTGLYQIINSIERSRILTADFDTGRLGSLIQARNEMVPSMIDQIDTLANTLISEVNRMHSGSIGLESFNSLTSALSVSNPTEDLADLDLDFPAQAGSFVIRVTNANQVVQNLFTVNFDPTVDSLTDLAARIDAIDGTAGPGGGEISAIVTTDNQLQITSNGTYRFTFQGDTSHVLETLGLNTFFSGSDSHSIAISEFIADADLGLRRIAASATGAPGDNGGALQLAGLQNALIADGRTTTLGDSYRRTIAELGVRAQRNTTEFEASTSSLSDLKERQESVSGVSIDEESINLIKYQQAFAASARYITTVDSLIDRVINGLGITR